MESWIALKTWFAFLMTGSVLEDAADKVRSGYIASMESGGRMMSQVSSFSALKSSLSVERKIGSHRAREKMVTSK